MSEVSQTRLSEPACFDGEAAMDNLSPHKAKAEAEDIALPSYYPLQV